ncbi:MAG: hypothetical protein Q4C56_09675 [Peptococcaceae bacterium]|nr:hypothetical protein [Peptococcaceae bacterium]
MKKLSTFILLLLILIPAVAYASTVTSEEALSPVERIEERNAVHAAFMRTHLNDENIYDIEITDKLDQEFRETYPEYDDLGHLASRFEFRKPWEAPKEIDSVDFYEKEYTDAEGLRHGVTVYANYFDDGTIVYGTLTWSDLPDDEAESE